jgi:hypothetical protein
VGLGNQQNESYDYEHYAYDDHQIASYDDLTPRAKPGLSVLGVVGALALVRLRVVESAAEFPHALAHGARGVWQSRRPEHEQGDDAHDQQLEWSYLEHATESRPA